MKFLKTKQEICEAINLKNYPVLTMDINEIIKNNDKIVGFEGCKFRKNKRVFNGVTLFDKGTLCWFSDTKTFVFMEQSICVKSSFTYYDLKEHYEFANSPIVNNGEVVIIITDNKNEEIKVILLTDLTKKEQINLFDYI